MERYVLSLCDLGMLSTGGDAYCSCAYVSQNLSPMTYIRMMLFIHVFMLIR